jgi:probable F420-dependent oxidoreductase
VKFGIWLDFRNPPQWRQPWAEVYHDNLSLAVLAERLGFESVWVSEHHLTFDGYLPSVFPVLAAIAARTQRVRLGSAVVVAPLHHPLRLAEDAAVVDLLSRGRLDLGIAPGYRRHEFQNLGIAHAERGSRTDETIEVLRLAWTGRPFSFPGRHFQFNDVTVTPTPQQASHPPIWIGGSSRAAAVRAGRYGCHFLPDRDTPTSVVDLYRSTLADHGHQVQDFHITVTAAVHVCHDPVRGWNEIHPHYRYAANLYRQWASRPPLPEPDDVDRSRYLVGPPDTVVDGLRQAGTTQVDRLIFWARPPGLPIAAARQSLTLFAEHVMPQLK